jgi:hypothetical protein
VKASKDLNVSTMPSRLFLDGAVVFKLEVPDVFSS